MNPDFLQLLLILLQVLLAAFGTVIFSNYRDLKVALEEARKSHSEAVEDLRRVQAKSDETHAQKLSDYKLHVSEHYVTQNFFNKALEGLTESVREMRSGMADQLNRIEKKLDGKQDK